MVNEPIFKNETNSSVYVAMESLFLVVGVLPFLFPFDDEIAYPEGDGAADEGSHHDGKLVVDRTEI